MLLRGFVQLSAPALPPSLPAARPVWSISCAIHHRPQVRLRPPEFQSEEFSTHNSMFIIDLEELSLLKLA
jgi:hypothetical protein